MSNTTEMKTSSDILQQVTTDLFMIKEKIEDNEYLMILNRCKKLFDRIDKDKSTTLKLYKRYDRLRDKYIKMSSSFINLYHDCHESSDEEETLITFVRSD